MADQNPSKSYASIKRPGHPAVHCEALTGRLVMGGRCWGEVGLVEVRLIGRAVPRCQGHAGPTYKSEPGRDADLRRRLGMAARGLEGIGWEISDLDVDVTAGTGRAEFRSFDGRRLRIAATARGAILERDQERTVHVKRRGLPTTEVVRDFIGRSRAPDFPTAMREAVRYMVDNRPAALAGDLGQRQRQLTKAATGLLARAVAQLSPVLPSSEPRRSAECTPMSDGWTAELDRVCCRGDGWDPYIPSVTAGDDCDVRRWVATSGTIVDGRGVHREGTYARGPLL